MHRNTQTKHNEQKAHEELQRLVSSWEPQVHSSAGTARLPCVQTGDCTSSSSQDVPPQGKGSVCTRVHQFPPADGSADLPYHLLHWAKPYKAILKFQVQFLLTMSILQSLSERHSNSCTNLLKTTWFSSYNSFCNVIRHGAIKDTWSFLLHKFGMAHRRRA